MKKSYSVISAIFLTGYLWQHYYNVQWPWLAIMQKNDIYKQISGLIILLFILSQWYLSILRIRNKMAKAFVELNIHRTLGVLAPLFLYFHTTRMGNYYLFFLSVTFLAIFTMGFLHPSVFGIQKQWLIKTWIICHVGTSTLLMLLLGQHIFISYWYE